MIFSKFFKAKWQSKQAVVRIEAINDELKPANPQDLDILLSLLSTDPDNLVRRAVLIKLATFEHWLQASQDNDRSAIRQFASDQIGKMLQNQHSLLLSKAQKRNFLSSTNLNGILETWLTTETDAELVIALYQKLEKPQQLVSLFSQKQNIEVQTFLLQQVQDISTLEKLLKKAATPAITKLIEAKLADLSEQAERPIKLRKQVQLLLSKLLALREQTDYVQVIERQPLLVEEWHQCIPEFAILSLSEQQTLTQKYQDISTQLSKLFAVKAEQYQQQQIALQLEQQQQQQRTHVLAQLAHINQALTASVFEHNNIDQAEFEQQLDSLVTEVMQSQLNDAEQQSLQTKIAQQRLQLTKLPEIAEAVSEATQLISKISQCSLPSDMATLNDKMAQFEQWRKAWQRISRQAGEVLPESIVKAQQEIVRHWREGLKPLQQQQHSLFLQSQKKLADIKRLLNSGKFNACFAIHKKLQQQLSLLSVIQQAKLQRELEQVNQRMAELSDWEHYVATPKKQALLAEMQTLIDMPLDNPNEQATRIKQARQQWNSFGHADHDEQLNQQFNQAAELAFTPCRLFFAEQENIRIQSLTVRQELIGCAEALAASFDATQVDWRKLDGALVKLNQQWLQAGEVDRRQYKDINQKFNTVLAPLKQALVNYHQMNVSSKQALITQAQVCLTLVASEATQRIKTLQQEWKSIGYAGPRMENKLWQQFRTVNDQIFAQREQLKQQDKLAEQAQQQEYQQQCEQLLLALAKTNQQSVLSELAQQVEQLIVQVPSDFKQIIHKMQQLQTQIGAKQQTLVREQQKYQWSALFQFIEQAIARPEQAKMLLEQEDFSMLPNSWQKRLQETLSLQHSADRQISTLELEILAGQASPAALQQQRMAAQVGLMQQKMNSGEASTDLEQKLVDWLCCGKLEQTDLTYVERIKPIFCH